MPYEIYWYVEKRVIGTRFYGEVAETDISSQVAAVTTYIAEGIQPIFLLADTREISKYPTNIKELLDAMSKNPTNSANLAWTLVITENRLINFIGAIVSNVFKAPLRTCKTFEEAEAFMAHHSAELEPVFEARKNQ